MANTKTRTITASKKQVQTESFEFKVQGILDSVIKVVQGFGFRQIIPPPFVQKKVFIGNPDLEDQFGNLNPEVEVAVGEGNILSPTQIYNAVTLYTDNVEELSHPTVKWFYLAPVSRLKRGKPTIGHELGVFVFGENTSLATAQMINASQQLLTKLGIEDVVSEINSIGCTSCQKQYQEILESHFAASSSFCDNCSQNLKSDAIKVLKCNESGCKQELDSGPQVVDFLDESCRESLVGTLEIMDEMEVPYVLNPHLAIPPFAEQILFRVGTASDKGFSSLLQGGDYSVCATHLGHDSFPLLGMTGMIEDLAKQVVLENIGSVSRVDVFVISLGDQAARRAMRLYQKLRRNGINTAEAMVGNSGIQRQLKEAHALQPEVTLIVGQKEALDDTVILRDMQSGMQEVFTQERILEEVKKRLEG